MNPQKRFAVIGLPGSGKSTFAMLLGKALNIPVHHFDSYLFEKTGEKKSKQELLAIEKTLTATDSWIIEGCSITTLEMRFTKATTVIYFRLPRLLCLARLLKRAFFYKALSKTGSLRILNMRLVKYLWSFDKEKGKKITELHSKYPHVEFILFQNPKDVDSFIKRNLQ